MLFFYQVSVMIARTQNTTAFSQQVDVFVPDCLLICNEHMKRHAFKGRTEMMTKSGF